MRYLVVPTHKDINFSQNGEHAEGDGSSGPMFNWERNLTM